MKAKSFFMCMMLAMPLGFTACSNDNEEPAPENPPVTQPYLQLGKENYDIDGKKQAVSVTVKTNIKELSMTFHKKEKWISLDDIKEGGDSDIYLFNVEQNRDDSTRVEIIIFRAREIAKAATIIQHPFEE